MNRPLAGDGILHFIPPIAGACVAMSARWVAILRDNLNLPAYCVAGDFVINGYTIWNSGSVQETASAFQGVNLDWNGHAWMFIGGHVGDAAIFRTAYLPNTLPHLTGLIRKKFVNGTGALMMDEADRSKRGLSYIPKHVLTDTQLTGVVLGFRAVLERRRPK